MKVGNITRRVAGESDESACPGRDTGAEAQESGRRNGASADRLPRQAGAAATVAREEGESERDNLKAPVERTECARDEEDRAKHFRRPVV